MRIQFLIKQIPITADMVRGIIGSPQYFDELAKPIIQSFLYSFNNDIETVPITFFFSIKIGNKCTFFFY